MTNATIDRRATSDGIHPPGPRRRVPALDALRMGRDRLGFLTMLRTQYGDIARVPLGAETLYLFSDPELVRDVLVTNHRNFHKGRGLERAKKLLGDGLLTSEGEVHLRQRRLAQPAFHRQRVAAYGATMASYAAARRDRWRTGATIDAHQEMMALTLAIVGKTLFDADVEDEAAEIGAAITTTFESFNFGFYMPFGALIERLPFPATLRFRRARARLDATIYRLIAERRRSGTDRGDLLSMLLLAQDTEGDGGGMTDLQLRDEAMTIFLAGHETTANALTWTWYLLSQHPDVEARMHAEIDSALGGRLPSADDLPAAALHANGAGRVDAAVSAGVDRRPARGRAVRGRRLHDPGAVHSCSCVSTRCTATHAGSPTPSGSTPSVSLRSSRPAGRSSRTSRSAAVPASALASSSRGWRE